MVSTILPFHQIIMEPRNLITFFGLLPNFFAGSVSLQNIFDMVPPMCALSYFRGGGDSPLLENMTRESQTSQVWKTPFQPSTQAISSSGKFTSNGNCNWIIFAYLTITEIQEIRMNPTVFHGYNIVVSRTLYKVPPYPLSHMKNVVYLVHMVRRSDVLRPYGINVFATSFQPLPSVGFRHRTNFHGKQLVWGVPNVFALPRALIMSYRETRDTLNHFASLLLDVTNSLNATISAESFDYYIDTADSKSIHLIPPVPLTKITVNLGIPLDVGSWSSVKAFVRLPHVLKKSQNFNMEGYMRDPYLAILAGIPAVFIAYIKGYPVKRNQIRKLLQDTSLVLLMYLNQPLPSSFMCKVASRNAAKIALLPYLLGIITLVSLKQTQFVTDMTAATVHHPPRTFPKLLESDYNITYYGINKTSSGGMVRHVEKLGCKIVNQLMQRDLHHIPFNKRRGCMYRLVTEEKLACIGGYLAGYASGMGMFGKRGVGFKLFDSTRDSLVSFPIGVVINRKLPHIEAVVRKVLVAHMESGLNFALHTDTWAIKTNFSNTTSHLRLSALPMDNSVVIKGTGNFLLKVLPAMVLVVIAELIWHT